MASKLKQCHTDICDEIRDDQVKVLQSVSGYL